MTLAMTLRAWGEEADVVDAQIAVRLDGARRRTQFTRPHFLSTMRRKAIGSKPSRTFASSPRNR